MRWETALIGLMLVGLAGCKSASSTTAAAGVAPGGAQQVQVTSGGFVPGTISAPAGAPVTLMVTRTTDRTCVRDFVMPMYGINQPLPLNQPVPITFTPMDPGSIPFSCQMGMVNGMVIVK